MPLFPKEASWFLWVTFQSCTPWKLVGDVLCRAKSNARVGSAHGWPARRGQENASGAGRAGAREGFQCGACKAVSPSPLCPGMKFPLLGRLAPCTPSFLSASRQRKNAVSFYSESPQANRIIQVGYHNATERSTQENPHLSGVGKSGSGVSAYGACRSSTGPVHVPAQPCDVGTGTPRPGSHRPLACALLRFSGLKRGEVLSEHAQRRRR